MSSSHSDPSHNALAALDRAAVWINSEPLTAEGLRGQVVAIDIGTYSCVNWLRTLPYVQAWDARYRDRGLVVVGVHSPEFGFEHEVDNVSRAVSELRIEYPVVLDNDFAIWRSLKNEAWPGLYLVDRDGRARFRHFGEGAYEEIERTIQQLLGIDEQPASIDATGLAEAADWDALGTGETYVGARRGVGRVASPDDLALNEWAFSGDWRVEDESALLAHAGGSITFRFRARDVNLVLAPPPSGAASRFAIRLDDHPPRDDHGLDIDDYGAGTLDEPRMYQLIRQADGAAERTCEITFLDAGVRAYVFTFG
ncbi:MAG TPA: hypothetical protein VGM91_13835 [Conexibacter sp.]|jgi:hypothetical protein